MPLKKVIREKYVIEEHITAAICNVCGKVGEPEDKGQGWPYGFHLIEIEGGWGDHFPGDLERFQIVVCEDCLKAWVGTFKHPDVTHLHRVYGSTEAIQARHSETEEWLHVQYGWARPEGTPEPEEDCSQKEWPDDAPRPNTIWQHFKGMRYLIREIVFMVGTEEPMVLYQGLYGDSDFWVRPLTMWHDPIDRETYQGPRFTEAPLPVTEAP